MARRRDDSTDVGFDSGLGVRFTPAPGGPALDGPMFTYPGARQTADPFSMFDDPSTRYLTDIIHQQIGQYSQPVTLDPNTASVLTYLKGVMGGGGGLSASANPLLGDFISEGRQRIAELNQAPFTSAEEDALKTRTRDDLTKQRDQQYQNAREDIARRGMADTSGLLDDRLKAIDSAYTAADAKGQNDLMLWIADQAQQRKNQAASIAQALAGAGAQEAARSDAMRQASSNQIMAAATAIANIAAQQRGEARANQQQVLNLAAMMAQLPVDRLNLLLGIVNGTGGGPNAMNSLFGNTLALSNQQQQQNAYANQGTAAFLSGLSTLAGYYANRGKQAGS
jgi:hypothetical protein